MNSTITKTGKRISLDMVPRISSESIEELTIAIIKNAVDDYREGFFLKDSTLCDSSVIFFKSEDYENMTDLDYKFILKKIDEEMIKIGNEVDFMIFSNHGASTLTKELIYDLMNRKKRFCGKMYNAFTAIDKTSGQRYKLLFCSKVIPGASMIELFNKTFGKNIQGNSLGIIDGVDLIYAGNDIHMTKTSYNNILKKTYNKITKNKKVLNIIMESNDYAGKWKSEEK